MQKEIDENNQVGPEQEFFVIINGEVVGMREKIEANEEEISEYNKRVQWFMIIRKLSFVRIYKSCLVLDIFKRQGS